MGVLLDFAAPLCVLSALAEVAFSQGTATAPGQPLQTGPVGQFQIVGESLVSAQQVSFLRILSRSREITE